MEMENETRAFFEESSVCPTCTQNIDETFRLNKIEEQKNKFNELNTGFLELEKTILEEETREVEFTKLFKGDFKSKQWHFQ